MMNVNNKTYKHWNVKVQEQDREREKKEVMSLLSAYKLLLTPLNELEGESKARTLASLCTDP